MASASPLVQMVKTWEPEEVTSNQPWTPSSPTPHEAHRRLSLRKSLETYQEHILLGGGGSVPYSASSHQQQALSLEHGTHTPRRTPRQGTAKAQKAEQPGCEAPSVAQNVPQQQWPATPGAHILVGARQGIQVHAGCVGGDPGKPR